MWAGEDSTDGSAVADRSIENLSPEVTAMTRKPAPGWASPQNGKYPLAGVPGVLRLKDGLANRNGDCTLPHDKAFSIQIGWRLFRLSGASIMSDAPSYFSSYFEEQLKLEEEGKGSSKTLYIDRDPETFADICRHLQGYFITPQNGPHFIKLYADAQFYSLPRLASQLFDSDMYVTVGGVPFIIPRDSFSGPGNSSNFFALGFAGFIASKDDAFPGLQSRSLMRPPPIAPQNVPNRSPDILRDLITLSRGYSIHVRDANHRAALVGDCKYYGFKGLMHKLFAHEISYNAERGCSEIVMRIEDLHKSGISFFSDPSPADQSPLGGWVHYARPFVDETSFEVIVEIGAQETKIDFRSNRAEFYGDTKARISSLFQTVADKMNLPNNLPLGLMMSSGGASAAPASPANTPLSEDRVKISLGPEAYILLDGVEHQMDSSSYTYASSGQSEHDDWASIPPQSPLPRASPRQQQQQQQQQTSVPGSAGQQQQPPNKKRKRRGSLDEFGEWIIKKGQWRLRVQPKTDGGGGGGQSGPGRRGGGGGAMDAGMEIVLHAVKLEAFSGQRGRNMGRTWLA